MVYDSATIGVALLTGCIAAVIIHFIRARRPVANYPPGPWGVPLLGNLLSYDIMDLQQSVMKLWQEYGSVCSLVYGQNHMVIVNGIGSIKEALVTRKDDFADRQNDFTVELYNPKYLGIGDAHFDENWYNQRHFTHKTLRGFGFGKISFESKIMEEVEFLTRYFKDNLSKPIDIRNFITNCVSNIICSITFGQRYDHFKNPEFLKVTDAFRDWFAFGSSRGIQLGQVFPSMRPLLWKEIRALKETVSKVTSFVVKEIERKQEKLADIDEPGDFIESYLKEIERDKEGKYTTEYLKHNVIDLFVAGTETTSTSLTWAVLYMMVNPEVQRRVQKELDEVVGRKALPSYTQRGDLPYTEATLLEVQRIASLVPIIPRATIRATTLGGYNIPANTDVNLMAWTIHRDPKLYPQPEKFDPNRFLTEDGKLQKNESFMPFGAGRRVCMGESLAKLELFLFFTTMLQRFTFSVPEGAPPPSLEGTFNLTRMPKPYKVVIRERDN